MLKVISVIGSGLIMGYFFGNLLLGVVLALGIEWLYKQAY